MMMNERRTVSIRRDINDLVRDENGHVSLTKIGGIVGQGLAVKLILEHGSEIISNWDSLTVLFSVLMAPGMLFKFVNMKYGGTNGNDPVAVKTTTETETSITQKKGKKQ
jgi:hypothetical protein